MTTTGIYRGHVINTDDPRSQQRVQVRVPQVLGESSVWAEALYVLNPTAVLESASQVRPSVGDRVWIQFDGGDMTRPLYDNAVFLATGPTGPQGPPGPPGDGTSTFARYWRETQQVIDGPGGTVEWEWEQWNIGGGFVQTSATEIGVQENGLYHVVVCVFVQDISITDPNNYMEFTLFTGGSYVHSTTLKNNDSGSRFLSVDDHQIYGGSSVVTSLYAPHQDSIIVQGGNRTYLSMRKVGEIPE